LNVYPGEWILDNDGLRGRGLTELGDKALGGGFVGLCYQHITNKMADKKATSGFMIQGGFDFLPVGRMAGELGVVIDPNEAEDTIGSHFGLTAGIAIANLSVRFKRYEPTVDAGFRLDIPSLAWYRFLAHDADGDGIGDGFSLGGGRPLRDEEGFADLAEACLKDADALEESIVRQIGAETWSKRAREEWASVPAFTQLLQQLEANQAPRSFVTRARAARADEVRHTMLSAGMASMYADSTLSLEPPETGYRAPVGGVQGLIRLAVESWLDGCLGEGFAARDAFEEAKETRQPQAQAALLQICRDEQRHGELAWDILRWALQEGGKEVADAVRRARYQAPIYTTRDESALDAKLWMRGSIASANQRLDALLAAC